MDATRYVDAVMPSTWRGAVRALVAYTFALVVFHGGVRSAYAASSPETVVPEYMYLELLSGHENAAEAVVQLTLTLPLYGFIDATGRLWYALFLWVPESAANALLAVATVLPFAFAIYVWYRVAAGTFPAESDDSDQSEVVA